jgi:hypothetical protein
MLAVSLATVVGLAAVACDGGSQGMSVMDRGSMTSSAAAGHSGIDMAAGDGLSPSASGFRFVLATSPLPAGQPAEFRFQIVGADGRPVTAFELDQTKLMHFYLIRSDLTGFQHVHPTMGGDGTWSAPVQPVEPGSYRAHVSFIAKDTSGKAVPLVLSDHATIAGSRDAVRPISHARSSLGWRRHHAPSAAPTREPRCPGSGCRIHLRLRQGVHRRGSHR